MRGWLPIIALAAGLGPLVPAPAEAGVQVFQHKRFSFTFTYPDTWIPRKNVDGESVTFALEAGEILVSIERARNPARHKTADEFADAIMASFRDRVVFDKLDKRTATLDGKPAVLVSGTGKLFDEPNPYKVTIYVAEREGRFYVVKFTGLYDKRRQEFSQFEQLVRTLKLGTRVGD